MAMEPTHETDQAVSAIPFDRVLEKALESNVATQTETRLSKSLDQEEQPTESISTGQPISSQKESSRLVASQPDRTVRGVKWATICFSLYVTAFLYGLDTTIAADVQSSVVEVFGHIDQLPWVGAGFPLGSVSTILLIGKLYSYFNLKWIFITSVALFEIGSVLCGASPNMDALIVGRVLAGCGGAGIYLGNLNYFSYFTSPNERGLYINITGCVFGVGCVLGPIIGGAFSNSHATWRWAFYINLVLGAVVAPSWLFVLPSIHPSSGKGIMERMRQFDFLGILLIAATWVSFTIGFTMAGNVWAWNDGRTIAVLVVLGVLLLLTISQQYFTLFTTPATRTFPGHLLRSRTQILLIIASATSSSALFVFIYYIPIYFQFVHSDSAIQAGVRLLPFMIVSVAFNLIAGHFLPKVKWYMSIYLVGAVFIIVGTALLRAYLDPATNISTIYGLTILIAVGAGLTTQIGYSIASLAVSLQDMSNAISLQNISQIGSVVISLVITGQIFLSEAVEGLNHILEGRGFSSAEIQGAVAGAQSALFDELSPDLKAAATEAIVQAMQKAFILVIVTGGILFVSSLLMKRKSLLGQVLV